MAKSKKTRVSKKPVEKTTTLVPVNFPVSVPATSPLELKPVPALAKLPKEFEVKCQVESVATHYWSGTIFVALKATDGQNLIDLLCQDQEVVLHYQKKK